ncbi:hypothetical protein [Eubacterium maltosivorans]|uniref:O-antigen polysaccharide polymerase Wzy n=1 Tax=Eubacterium maltosivorans TaxID=2041044 RepID=A0A4P9C646_EUBML|nr:hypothetical protein [Eubacterium maltosivorans]QCT70867.1 hypothetical protein CPZ25_005835 [Eubacterium maltosivorans]
MMFLDYLILILVLFLILEMRQCNIYNKTLIGVVLVFCSLELLFKFKNDKMLIFVFGIITYINLSLVISDCLTNGMLALPIETTSWQKLRGTEYDLIFVKSLVLFISTLNALVPAYKGAIVKEHIIRQKKNNIYIFLGIYFVLWIILITGYAVSSSSLAGYESNTTTFFEYSTALFLIAWYYSGTSKKADALLKIYAVTYIFRAVVQGDRSSAFPMILIIVILYLKKNISLKKLFLIAVLGIFCSNIISVYRLSYSTQNIMSSYITQYGLKGFASDTVSQSFYTGISIIAAKSQCPNSFLYFIDFLIGIVIGGSYGKANLTEFTLKYYMNKGGGMLVSSWYFWFGYAGIIILSIIMAHLLKKMQGTKETDFQRLLKIYFTATAFRWYLYTSFDLFRGVLFVFPVMFLFFQIIDQLIKNKQL